MQTCFYTAVPNFSRRDLTWASSWTWWFKCSMIRKGSNAPTRKSSSSWKSSKDWLVNSPIVKRLWIHHLCIKIGGSWRWSKNSWVNMKARGLRRRGLTWWTASKKLPTPMVISQIWARRCRMWTQVLFCYRATKVHRIMQPTRIWTKQMLSQSSLTKAWAKTRSDVIFTLKTYFKLIMVFI